PHHLLPLGLLDHQPPPALSRKTVILELARPFAAFPLRRQPTLALHSVKRRVQRPVVDLQYIFGAALNVFGDLMSVRGAQQQRAQNQHVERSPKQVDLFAACLHGRYSTLLGRLSTIEKVSKNIFRRGNTSRAGYATGIPTVVAKERLISSTSIAG